MAVVYQHLRTDTGEIFYVGIGKTSKRAYSKHGRSKPWRDFSKKHSYSVQILAEDLTWNQACESEKDLIRLYGRRDLALGSLVNMTDGGDGVENLPIETLKLIGSKLKGRAGTFTGKTHTEESKEKNRNAHLGRKYSTEVNAKKAVRGGKNGNSRTVYDPKTKQTFSTVTEAAIFFNVTQNTIRDRARKKLLIIKKR
jgi:hypothetical protein